MDINFNKNEDNNKLLLSDLRQRYAQVKLGGGEKRIAKLNHWAYKMKKGRSFRPTLPFKTS